MKELVNREKLTFHHKRSIELNFYKWGPKEIKTILASRDIPHI